MNQLASEAELQAELNRLLSTGEARAIREAAGLSLTVVGRSLGCRGSAVSRWEAGLRRPHGKLAIAYLTLLKRLRAAAPL